MCINDSSGSAGAVHRAVICEFPGAVHRRCDVGAGVKLVSNQERVLPLLHCACELKRPMSRHCSNDERSNHSDSSQIMRRRLPSAPRRLICEDTHERDRQALCDHSSKKPDAREAAKLRKRKSRSNMTPERHDAIKSNDRVRNRVSNMTPERHDATKSNYRVRNRVSNMTPERHDATKSKDQVRKRVNIG